MPRVSLLEVEKQTSRLHTACSQDDMTSGDRSWTAGSDDGETLNVASIRREMEACERSMKRNPYSPGAQQFFADRQDDAWFGRPAFKRF